MATSTVHGSLDTAVLRRYRRAADYLAAAMIFLRDNALVTEPLRAEHLKPRLLGGIDVGTGVLAYLLVKEATGWTVVAGLAFSVGFVVLLLARAASCSPKLPRAGDRRRGPARLHRRAGPAVGSVARGEPGRWLGVAWLIVHSFPQLRQTAVDAGTHFAHLGDNLRSFTLAVLAGMVITLITRMQHATDNLGVRLVRRCCSARSSPAGSSSTAPSTRSSCSPHSSPAGPRSATPTGWWRWAGPRWATSSAASDRRRLPAAAPSRAAPTDA